MSITTYVQHWTINTFLLPPASLLSVVGTHRRRTVSRHFPVFYHRAHSSSDRRRSEILYLRTTEGPLVCREAYNSYATAGFWEPGRHTQMCKFICSVSRPRFLFEVQDLRRRSSSCPM